MLNKLERKIHGNRWPSIALIFLILYIAGAVADYISPAFRQLVCFNPYAIAHGQVWRLFSFLMVNLYNSNIFMLMITTFIYFSIIRTIEQIVGRFKISVFMLMGWLLLIVAGYACYFIMGMAYGSPQTILVYTTILNPYFLFSTLFTLFALAFPDARFLLFFFIPVKGKWLIFITVALDAIEIISMFVQGAAGVGWMYVFMVVAAGLTLLFFLLLNGFFKRKSGAYTQKQAKVFTQSKMKAPSQEHRHKCAICGRTEVTNPELEFRYCSKCIGPFEYCNEHLYTHVHKRPDGMN